MAKRIPKYSELTDEQKVGYYACQSDMMAWLKKNTYLCKVIEAVENGDIIDARYKVDEGA